MHTILVQWIDVSFLFFEGYIFFSPDFFETAFFMASANFVESEKKEQNISERRRFIVKTRGVKCEYRGRF